jgi:hypothetical protein
MAKPILLQHPCSDERTITSLVKEHRGDLTFHCAKYKLDSNDLRTEFMAKVGIQVANALSLFGRDDDFTATIYKTGGKILFAGQVSLPGNVDLTRLPSVAFNWIQVDCIGFAGRRQPSFSTWKYIVEFK